MPDVNDEYNSVKLRVIPCLVFLVIVQQEAASFLPIPFFAPNADRAVTLWYLNPQMATNSDVCRPTMGRYVRARPHLGDIY